LIAALLVASRGLTAWVSHDEPQFVAPGLLTWREGLLPYRDYPLFHAPYWVLLNGLAGAWADNPILAARVLSLGALGVTFALLLAWGARGFGERDERAPWVRALGAAALLALLACSPPVLNVARYCWNHAGPVACAVVAFAAVVRTGSSRAPAWVAFGAGVAVALAAGMRLSFAPLVAPLGLGVLLWGGTTWRARGWAACGFGAGVIAGLSPFALFAALDPEAARFGNLGYPKLSLAWRKYPFWEAHGATDPVLGYIGADREPFRGRPFGKKVGLFLTRDWPGNLPLLAAWGLVGVPLCVARCIRERARAVGPGLLCITMPFVVWGCLAPSRYNPQYAYAAAVFMVLFVGVGLAGWGPGRLRRWAAAAVAAAALAGIGMNVAEYGPGLRQLAEPSRWGPAVYRAQAAELFGPWTERRGRVATLEPLFAMQAGLRVAPEFCLGEFAWRCAHLLPREQRERLKILGPVDFEEWAARERPSAVYLDYAKKENVRELNAPLRAWAERAGFEPRCREERREFWVDKP
jgi:MFS family permease